MLSLPNPFLLRTVPENNPNKEEKLPNLLRIVSSTPISDDPESTRNPNTSELNNEVDKDWNLFSKPSILPEIDS